MADRTGRVGRLIRGVLLGTAGVASAALFGVYLFSYVTTGHDPFRPETTEQQTTKRPVARAKVTPSPAVSRQCHVNLGLDSLNDTLMKMRRCRRLRLDENGVVVTVKRP
jgi:hypothetical protein